MSVFQDESKNFAAYVLAHGARLALGTGATTPLAVGFRGYADVPVVWGQAPTNADEGTAYLLASNGVLTNTATFKWPEADDETGASSDGFGTITHFFILDSARSILFTAAFNPSFTLPQDWRARFDAGELRLTFTIEEVSS